MTTQSNPHAALAPLPAPLAELAAGVELLDPMEAPAIRWGILGAGGIAAVFAHDVAAYSSGVMAGIAARDPKRAQEFAATYNVEKAYDSYEDLVAADDIDAVYVAAVHPQHEKLATLALNAGKPVLVEKCFTMDATSAKRVLDLAKEKTCFAWKPCGRVTCHTRRCSARLSPTVVSVRFRPFTLITARSWSTFVVCGIPSSVVAL